ncbi:MAG TPA: SGNH/GDSL hydrolase family protein, partial [Cyclobacteriaceae bacterium]|nr:SGNH/GDSL hydrolase family protein [Cyclobacteriaceae bacterium]
MTTKETPFAQRLNIFSLILLALCLFQCSQDSNTLKIEKGSRIFLVGNNLPSRMMNYGHFETEMHLRYPDSTLYIRNMGDGGNTPGFRPHSGRNTPWAFPGAEQFQTELAKNSESEGHLETEDEWLKRLQADIILAFFGYNESFEGPEGLENYKGELEAFIHHTFRQKYNGDTTQLAIVSPIAFEDLSDRYDLPNGDKENENLALYTAAMKEIAERNNVLFVDAFNPSKDWYASSSEPLTIDGFQLNEEGYKKFAVFLADRVFGEDKVRAGEHRELVHAAVKEKNWMWHNDFKIPNGVHVFGRRYDPFGPDNYPAEIQKIREMTDIRDQAIWKAVKGEKMDVRVADEKTTPLPSVETNLKYDEKNPPRYLYGEEALSTIKVSEGYKIELFASEEEFEDLANPVQ